MSRHRCDNLEVRRSTDTKRNLDMPGHLLRSMLSALTLTSFLVSGALAAEEVAAPAAAPGPAETADPNDPVTHDPLEGLNRAVFEVNGVFYEITTPLVEATPDPIRGLFKAIGTAVSAPVKIVTNIATGDPRKEHLSEIARQEDVDCGFFVVLHFAGPTTSRDAVGTGIELAANPGTYIVVIGAGDAANERIEAEATIRKLDGAIDKYALARSATLQDRGCIVTQEADAPLAFEETADKPAQEPVAAK
jgi:ABC-type transporter lipoprotein component MlaA